uniref:Ig-like domain-containing protein n=1 Tax=Mola mola TaxID=94237 RepID=A0A3Q3WQB2_MOLML
MNLAKHRRCDHIGKVKATVNKYREKHSRRRGPVCSCSRSCRLCPHSDKPAILQSPAHPVTEGVDVTLHCRDKNGSSDLPAAFFKTGSFIGMAATAHMTIRNFSKSDESVYKCHIGEHGESPGAESLCVPSENSGTASLTVLPSSSQLFQYENLFLSCGNNSSLLGWRVFRATSTGTSRDRFGRQRCGTKWGTENASGCVLHTVKKPDSGIYWCESLARQRSNSVNIQIHSKNTLVILQSPLLPVMAGDNVTLCCKTKSPASDLPAMFYKDDSLIRTDPSGHMTIHQVSRSHEGVYKCHISGHGESPASWLLVRVRGEAVLVVQSWFWRKPLTPLLLAELADVSSCAELFGNYVWLACRPGCCCFLNVSWLRPQQELCGSSSEENRERTLCK